METHQRNHTEAVDYEVQGTKILLYQGEIEHAKQEKTYLYREENEEQRTS